MLPRPGLSIALRNVKVGHEAPDIQPNFVARNRVLEPRAVAAGWSKEGIAIYDDPSSKGEDVRRRVEDVWIDVLA